VKIESSLANEIIAASPFHPHCFNFVMEVA